MKMHKMEHTVIFTESAPKVAPIELIESSLESADVGSFVRILTK
jgi:hypothetical protein